MRYYSSRFISWLTTGAVLELSVIIRLAVITRLNNI